MLGLSLAPSGAPLTPAQQRIGLRVVLINSTLMVLGFFTFIGPFALHFTHDFAFSAAMVGLALALRQFMQQGLDIFGGFFADHFGYRFSITLGCGIRILAFTSIGLAHTMPQLLLSACTIGLGGMFFDGAGGGSLVSFTVPQERPRIFALQATINNVGAAIGPVLGLFIYAKFGFAPVALTAAAIFACIGIITAIFQPEGAAPDATPGVAALTIGQTFRAIQLRRSYMYVVLLLMGFWAIAAQISLTVPLAGARIAGAGGVALLLGLNSFLAIPLQYPLVRLAERWLTPLQAMSASTFLASLGVVTIFLSPNLGWQVVGIVIFTIGSLAIVPMMATITSQVAPPRAFAAFYGFSAIGIGIGGGLGQFIGGRLYDLQRQFGSPLPMSAFLLLIGFGVAAAMLRVPSPTDTPVRMAADVEPVMIELPEEIRPVPTR